jgi:PAS domain S-box-containing protein
MFNVRKPWSNSGEDKGYAFRLRMLPLFIGVPALIVAFLVMAWGAFEREFESARSVRQVINDSFERGAQLQRVLSLLQDGESAQSGYVITGDTAFLQAYYAAVTEVTPLVDELRANSLANSADPDDIAQLESLIRRRISLFVETINTRRAGDIERAEELVSNGEGSRLTALIREAINDLTADEANRLQEATASEVEVTGASRFFTAYLLIAVGAFTVIGALWAFLLLDKRQRAERAADRQGRLVRFLNEIADASNRATFDLALQRTLEVVVADGRSPWGLAFRLDPSGRNPAQGSWVPEPQGDDPNAVIAFAAGEVRKLVGPVTIDLPAELGVNTASLNLTLVPIRNGKDVAGGLLIAGDAFGNPRAIGRGQRPYVMEQLSRAAERQRMSDAVADALARSEALFASASDGIVTVNESDTIERFNPAAEALFGYKSQEVVRRNFAMLLEPTAENGSAAQRLIASTLDTGHETLGRRKDGTRFPAEISVGAMDLGGRRLFVLFIRDISERKQIERMQSEFISTVSHELRTPLTSIGGSLSLIVGGAAGEINERARRLLEIAGNNTQRLIRLVNDILDIEKLRSGRMAFQFADTAVDDVLAQVVAANRGFADSFGVEIRQVASIPGGLIHADTDRLNQAITNLVSNAVKFSPRGVAVEVGAIKTGSGIRISVRDRGPGIPESFRPRIFERFSQADASDTRQKGGSGLGLSIAREIVHRHGGKISFESETGRGTVFHIDLPPAGASDHQPIRATAQSRRTILVCSRSEADAGILASALAAADFTCEVALTHEAALAAVGLGAVQAAVVDVSIVAGLDVSAFVRSLQETSPQPPLPVVLVALGETQRGKTVTAETLPVLYWAENKNELARLPTMIGELLNRRAAGKPTILHVEDDRDVLEVVRHALQDEFTVIPAPSLEMARQRLAKQTFQLVILDLTLSDGPGRDLLPELVGVDGKPLPIVVFSAQDATPDLARRVEAVLTKSRGSLATLVEAVRSVLSQPPPPPEQKARAL